MAAEPLPTPDDIKNAPSVIKIPNTLIMDKDGTMAREWIYFFNDIGRAVDQQITANLPELTQQLLDSVAEIIRLDEDADSTNIELAYAINDIADNKAAIITANQSISTNTADIATANIEISNQDGLIDGLTTRLNTKDTEVSTLQSTTATHTSDIATNASNIQAHSTTLADLEARVAALEAAP